MALVGACSSVPIDPPEHGASVARPCNAANVQRFMGEVGTSKTGAQIVHATRAAVLRWAPPGVMLTMDYRLDRVTVTLGPDGKITSIRCG